MKNGWFTLSVVMILIAMTLVMSGCSTTSVVGGNDYVTSSEAITELKNQIANDQYRPANFSEHFSDFKEQNGYVSYVFYDDYEYKKYAGSTVQTDVLPYVTNITVLPDGNHWNVTWGYNSTKNKSVSKKESYILAAQYYGGSFVIDVPVNTFIKGDHPNAFTQTYNISETTDVTWNVEYMHPAKAKIVKVSDIKTRKYSMT